MGKIPRIKDLQGLVSSISGSSSMRCGVHQDWEIKEIDAYVSERCESARCLMHAESSPKGHGEMVTGCNESDLRASPPRPGYVCAMEARVSGIDGGGANKGNVVNRNSVCC